MSCVLHQLLQVRMHYTIYFDMVKICYRVSDCALCHSDIEKMCCFCCCFLPLQAIIMSCIWNTQMFYTRHVYLFINTQIYSRICSAGPCRYGFRKQKKNWTCRNERCLPLSVTRVVQVLHIPSKVRTTKQVTRGFPIVHHSVMYPFPFGLNKHLG